MKTKVKEFPAKQANGESQNKGQPVERAGKEGKPMAATEKKINSVTVRDENGTKYTLEFNSRIVKRMERNGFKIDTDYPNTMIDELFTGAFQMHHKGMTPERIRGIWKFQRKKDELLGILTQLYMKPLEDLMDEPDEGEDTDPTWETA